MRRWVSSAAYDMLTRAMVQARTASGLTQREVAERLRKPPSYVAKIERKHQRVDLLELVAYLRAVGADENQVIAEVLAQLPADLDV